MKQRCLVCDDTGKYYWNNICSMCMDKVTFLCEDTGYTYINEELHFRICWCLKEEQQILRNKLKISSSCIS
jgi:hypothetical protein